MSLIPTFEIGVWNAWIFMVCIVILQPCLTRLIKKDAYKKMGNPSDMKLTKTEKRIGYSMTAIVYLALIYSIFLPLQLGAVLFYVALAIFVLALIVLAIASVNFATAQFDEPVTIGIYRYSGHPMYLALYLVFLGVGIASASWIFFLFSIVVLILMHFAAIPEERFCLEKYGDTYHEYMNKTPRWIGLPKSA